MDLDPDEIDIQLRSPVEVGRRMIALSAVAHLVSRSIDEEMPEKVDDDREGNDVDGADEAFDWSSWLERERLLDTLTSAERGLLVAVFATRERDELEDESSAVEALGALSWAAGLSVLTVLDRGYPYLELLDSIPSPWDVSTPFLSSLMLRSEDEIAAARESAEILSWRAQVEIERRRSTGRERSEIELAIRDVAAEVAAAGIASIGDEGDIEIDGASIAALSEPVVLGMVAASRARLRAMNWLCGLGAWDDPNLTEI